MHSTTVMKLIIMELCALDSSVFQTPNPVAFFLPADTVQEVIHVTVTVSFATGRKSKFSF